MIKDGLGDAGTPTPMAELAVTVRGLFRRIRIKLEGANPTGSIKYRTARALVDSLDQRGLLKPGTTLIESTSGNMGVALSALAADRGLEMLAIVDPNVTVENKEAMIALGAQVLVVAARDDHGGYLDARLHVVRSMVATNPSYVWTDQYDNPANPEVHQRETALEIAAQASPTIQCIFVAVSTGGTFAGISRFFQRWQPRTEMVAVDVAGSVALGGKPATRRLSGIGSSRPSSFLAEHLIDRRAVVAELDAVRACRRLADETGLRLGASSGAVVAACLRRMGQDPYLVDAVCVSADFGSAYGSTVYDDSWVADVTKSGHEEVELLDVVFHGVSSVAGVVR